VAATGAANVAAMKTEVTATQMLESMTSAPRPTRAESTDVANSVLDGTDCVMLSGETAAGAYPVEAIKVMAEICNEAEAYVDNDAVFKNLMEHQSIPMSVTESTASSAVRSAHKVGATLVLCLAESGHTASLIAKYRPNCRIMYISSPMRGGGVIPTRPQSFTLSSGEYQWFNVQGGNTTL